MHRIYALHAAVSPRVRHLVSFRMSAETISILTGYPIRWIPAACTLLGKPLYQDDSLALGEVWLTVPAEVK